MALGPDGRFLISVDKKLGELPEERAVEFASAWLTHHGPMLRTFIERTRGGPVDFARLSSCGRALYARAAFPDLPQEIPLPFRRPFGSWWLLSFCNPEGSPVVSIAVSTSAELTVHKGQLIFPAISGNEIFALGIPLGHQGEYPMSPEAAVKRATDATGARVTAVPELLMPSPSDGPPQLARWRIALSAPAHLRTQTRLPVVSEVFVGLARPTLSGESLYAAANDQEGVDLLWKPTPRIGESRAAYVARSEGAVHRLAIHHLNGRPVHFETAESAGRR